MLKVEKGKTTPTGISLDAVLKVGKGTVWDYDENGSIIVVGPDHILSVVNCMNGVSFSLIDREGMKMGKFYDVKYTPSVHKFVFSMEK